MMMSNAADKMGTAKRLGGGNAQSLPRQALQAEI